MDHTKYEVRIFDTAIKPCTFKNHALFAAVKHLCEDRKPRITPEAIQEASGLTVDEKRLFQAINRRVTSQEFIAEASTKNPNWVRDSNWWCKDGELIHNGGKTYAFNREWGHNFPMVRENLMKHFPEISLIPCP